MRRRHDRSQPVLARCAAASIRAIDADHWGAPARRSPRTGTPALAALVGAFALGSALACGVGATPTKAGAAKGERAAKAGADEAEAGPGKGPKSPPPSDALPPIPQGAIATIDETPIPREAFMAIYALKLVKYEEKGKSIPRSADRRYRRSISERLVYQELLRLEATKLGIDFDPARLAERKTQQRRGIADWDTHLRRRGESEDSLDQQIIAELRERAILEKLGVLKVDPSEIDAEYERIKRNYEADVPRIRASHILVQIGPDPHAQMGKEPPTDEVRKAWDEEAAKRARALHASATAPGADFAAVAREHSDSPTRAKDGDLGIFDASRMPEEFSAVAFKLEVGEVSKPIKTPYGYHIVKVTAKYGPGVLPKEAVADQLRDRLENTRFHRGRRDLRERLLTEHTVVNHITDALGAEPPRTSNAGARDRAGSDKAPEPAADDAPEPKTTGDDAP